jgi:hypothetical protein
MRPALAGALASLVACGGDDPRAEPATITARFYNIASTGQSKCYGDRAEIACPARGAPFFGQDGPARGVALRFRDNGDGTATDQTTGLMWQKSLAPERSWSDAQTAAAAERTGGHTDWRLPSIKELFTLMDFGRGYFGPSAAQSAPFIDTGVFEFSYGAGNRFIDVQLWSSTPYAGTTMAGDATVFGVNFADGRIKGYPRFDPPSRGAVPMQMKARYVRGPRYGEPDLVDRGDGTVLDRATGLLWQATDDGVTRPWADALAYCASLDLAGRADWRLPNIKELHVIVDYGRSPMTTASAAIAPPLRTTAIESYFWSSTTSLEGPPDDAAARAAYFAFGRALGWMELPPQSAQLQLIDVHGAGAQRADFKSGSAANYPHGFGPQGDDVRIALHVRCVAGG